MTPDEGMWGFACLIVLLLSERRGIRGTGAALVALTLCATWLATIALEYTLGDPKGQAYYPLIDLIAGVIIFDQWRRHPSFSKALVILLLTFQCAAHYLCKSNQSGYIAILNVMFAMQLLAAGYPGVKDACASLLGPFGPPCRRSHPIRRTYSAGRSGR